ncbi:hypothetical protein GUJ93_ZPchr0002g24542 [Zizania palustris]|uniref:Uncharacterized protein n=1 Tax=Zizania palustris TaxID=103762 RepID=A0A8J5RIJ6_ZIZPA|nr:hypothetical protein GUJ93_ZPchr0002g24542 [Zizania palustris]
MEHFTIGSSYEGLEEGLGEPFERGPPRGLQSSLRKETFEGASEWSSEGNLKEASHGTSMSILEPHGSLAFAAAFAAVFA